jgi:hypothetical protein
MYRPRARHCSGREVCTKADGGWTPGSWRGALRSLAPSSMVGPGRGLAAVGAAGSIRLAGTPYVHPVCTRLQPRAGPACDLCTDKSLFGRLDVQTSGPPPFWLRGVYKRGRRLDAGKLARGASVRCAVQHGWVRAADSRQWAQPGPSAWPAASTYTLAATGRAGPRFVYRQEPVRAPGCADLAPATVLAARCVQGSAEAGRGETHRHLAGNHRTGGTRTRHRTVERTCQLTPPD